MATDHTTGTRAVPRPEAIRAVRRLYPRKDLASELADVSIALALQMDVTPHEVLRLALKSFAWPESEWPKVQEALFEAITEAGGPSSG